MQQPKKQITDPIIDEQSQAVATKKSANDSRNKETKPIKHGRIIILDITKGTAEIQ